MVGQTISVTGVNALYDSGTAPGPMSSVGAWGISTASSTRLESFSVTKLCTKFFTRNPFCNACPSTSAKKWPNAADAVGKQIINVTGNNASYTTSVVPRPTSSLTPWTYLQLQGQDWTRFRWPSFLPATQSAAQAPQLLPPAHKRQLTLSVSRSSMLQGTMPSTLPALHQGQHHQSDLGASLPLWAQDWSRYPWPIASSLPSSLLAANSTNRFPPPTYQMQPTPSVRR